MQKIISHHITRDEEYGYQYPAFLNSFGFYEQIKKSISVSRPFGRKDYQILYVSNGKMNVNDVVIKSGEFYVMIPGEPQNYTYYATNNCIYYWMHFSGNKIEEMLSYYNISKGINTDNAFKHEIDTLFNSLLRVNSHDENTFNASCTAIFQSIFPLLGVNKAKAVHFSRAERLLSDNSSNVTIKELAEIYHISTEHFIRSFKLAYGKTPTNYRIYCRINQAKSFLIDTQLSVSDISNLCSFADAYYFSKIFKKYVGLTPTQYRNNFKEE